MMTTLAMVAGMVPRGAGVRRWRRIRSPMALAVIGGLIFSTILSLVFVPAMFVMMDDLGALIWRFGSKLLASSGENDRAGSFRRPQAAKDHRAFARGGVTGRRVTSLRHVDATTIFLPSPDQAVLDIRTSRTIASIRCTRAVLAELQYFVMLSISSAAMPSGCGVLLEAARSHEPSWVATDEWGAHWRLDATIRRQDKHAVVRTIWIVRPVKAY